MTAPAPVRVAARRVLENPEYFELVLDAPAIAGPAEPGQFVYVRSHPRPVADHLLRRAFTIAGCDNGTVTLLIKRVGALTGILSRSAAGDTIDVLGPLGNGYDVTRKADHAILVAGGYGVAPLLFLARRLFEGKVAGRVSLLVGARSAAHLLWRDRLAEHPWLETRLATEDGSAGTRGTVLDLLAELAPDPSGAVRMYACGPMGMLAAIARRWPGVPVQVAVEGPMGCGIGACMGCVLPTKPESKHGRYARVCMEGPVFDARDVDWDSMNEYKVQSSKYKVKGKRKT